VGLSLQSTLVVVVLCTEAAMEPATDCLLMDICCRWCLVVTEVVATDTLVGDDALVSVFVAAEATIAEALALAGEECLWLTATLFALPFPSRFAIV
jgi:hypothetical protein